MAEVEVTQDIRKVWLYERIATTFKHIKSDKFRKSLDAEENRRAIGEFLDNSSLRTLFIHGENLNCTHNMPSNRKKKMHCFIKLISGAVVADKINEQVLSLDVGADPLQQLELVGENVFLPILSNPANQAGWGEVAQKEIMEKFHSFMARVSITVGQIQGKTILPLPPTDNPGVSQKDRIHLLESAVVIWTKQIKNVLRQDPEATFKAGLHPTPDEEIRFWKARSENLNSINDQLHSPRLLRVLRLLEQSKSTYGNPFVKLRKEVMTARVEANDNVKFLYTLESWFDKLNSDTADFPKLVDIFKPMMHTILLIWRNSRYYNTPARLVVLMREICNALINQARRYISGKQIFEMIEMKEPGRAVEMLKTTIKVCGVFKTTYFDYKTQSNNDQSPWRIQNTALFVRLDSFLERCHDILDLTQTIVQFNKLGNMEIGGTKGKTLTNSVQHISHDFDQAVSAFESVPYDIMDVSAKQFDDDFYEFRCKIKELERRLASILTQAFDDCSTIYGRFKLLDSFEGLLERPIIQDELEKKQITLVQAYDHDLKIVQELFLNARDSPPMGYNMPPTAGALNWCRGLTDRIQSPMEKLCQLSRTVMEREEAREVTKVYNTIIKGLSEYQNAKVEEWGKDMEASSQAKLKLNLLRRDTQTLLLAVNFDPAIVRLLREVKYFLLLGLDVPDTAMNIYKKAEIYRKQTGNLDLIVNTYNRMMCSLLPVERPLIRSYLEKIDRIVEQGIHQLNWKSHGIDNFITEATSAVKAANDILSTLKGNMTDVEQILNKWAESALMARKNKPVHVEEFQQAHRSRLVARYNEIKEGGQQIHALLKSSNKVLKVSNGAPDWKSYVDFVNNFVVEGLAKVVRVSLQYLNEQLDPQEIEASEKSPMLEVELDLVGKDVSFKPPIFASANKKGIRNVVNGWIEDFLHVGTLFRRLDTNEGAYVKELQEDMYVQLLLANINESLSHTEDRCIEFRGRYEKYSYLWTSDMQKVFASFLQQSSSQSISGNLLLDLSLFDEEIRKYRDIQTTVIEHMRSPTQIGWLRVNSQPIKQALSTCVSKWQYMYSQYLQDSVVNSLSALYSFMKRVSAGLDSGVLEESSTEQKSKLMACMTHIRDVRKYVDKANEMFGPLRDTVALLKSHGIMMEGICIEGTEETRGSHDEEPIDTIEFLEAAPLKWEAVVNKTYNKKEQILPLQQAEVENIKADLDQFGDSVRKFRETFKHQAPFSFSGNPSNVYNQLDKLQAELCEMDSTAKRFNELEELFELQITKYKQIEETRQELKLLKMVWDFVSMISFTFDDWKGHLWNDINTDDLEDLTRKIQRQISSMGSQNASIKGWGVYKDLSERVKNMGVVLPLINDLHSPAMRDRHWKSLAALCHVKSLDVKDPKFSLENLLELNLHEHRDDVSEIVETANKELKIEKKLQTIEEAWSTLALEYVQHKDTDVHILKVPEEVVEALEGHQLELQSMIGMGKFVDYFRDRVTHWQRTLGNVETTMTVWISVTRQWASLESIFLASADIRAQLPDDTKRFEGIDQEFKDIMKAAVMTPNTIEACSVDGREESLRMMAKNLELCQKSLNEYLDMKKNIFPRFYFVSNQALLDILSNGNNPPKIMPYLGDCYDSIANLTFEEGSTNRTLDMIAKDGEVVPFSSPFVIQGAVENWLNELTKKQQDTLKEILDKALDAAMHWDADKPRHVWLDDYPAQIVLQGTQIYWTEETELALEEYEGGQEDSVRKYLDTCNGRLENLIKLVQGELTSYSRNKIIALITLDVHARDIVQKLVDQRCEGPSAFLWQSQLRYYYLQGTQDTDIRITDYRTKYSYEYVGNSGRLVITPLTDRCYITLTMALRLMLGGAPAGPAGTGKTETTKDLARALALPCYVFNCSDQMNYQTMGDIFKGLAQSGSWGCFDEFNRISIEVLSVVATQVKTILDAIVLYSVPANRSVEFQNVPAGTPPNKVGYFEFMGEMISLIPTCGFWITMNPGYAGRTELPENLKALFRSCAMIRPDLTLICENMLMSEGFVKARPLSIKFVTLYSLSSQLLSPQPHYDWGLRAVKSVLRVAGMLKRASPDMDEDPVLMRALRDFNTPKLPVQDMPIFMRLINDLFPGWDPKVSMDEDLKSIAVQVCRDKGLQSDETFITKVVNFQELLDVRHSVMLVGVAGCGKTTIYQTLAACHNKKKPKSNVYEVVNPKALTSNELYGYMTLSKDWKDGALSIIMRNMAKLNPPFTANQTSKWVVLDGDIDAVWIESMNTVMDDNKVLTLVSNERIPLSAAMRMVFEINSLKNATPATVSRAGILYINEIDIGWHPYVESWVATRKEDTEKSNLPNYFDKYIDTLLEATRKGFKSVTPVRTIAKVMTLCNILEGLLPTLSPEQKTPEVLEHIFVYATIWAFGGCLASDKNDYRKKFHEAWLSTFATIKFPNVGLIFDYFFNVQAGEMQAWSSADTVPSYSPVPIGSGVGETPFTSIMVPTADTVRVTFLLDMLVKNHKPIMLVGGAGTGKTMLVKDYLRNLDEDTLSTVINMNYYTDSFTLQKQLEGFIDKRSGKIFGPPSNKRLIYFVDDLNMSFVEEYGTQTPIELLRQFADYHSWYDRQDLGIRKEIIDVQFIAAMNPTAGSFSISERYQRHFATFACMMPSTEDLRTIYGSIIDGHLQNFSPDVAKLSDRITSATMQLHGQVTQKFLPSAIKFVYNWNMREFTNVFQGICLAKSEYFRQTTALIRLWLHECYRVFSDRLISDIEMEMFNDMIVEVTKRNFEEPQEEILPEGPLIFTNFTTITSGDSAYLPVPDYQRLKSVLETKLGEYNESNAFMELVLFEQAMEHVCRICRIIQNPNGNAMLVGVGGSGKQSLTRLATYICGYEFVQIQVTANFSVNDLKENLKDMYRKAGVKPGLPMTFCMTDTQIVDERFLVYVNDLLSSGWIPELFARDELDGIYSALRNEAKAAGVAETPDSMLEFFISRIRRNLHVVLCFSPVGDDFRVRARKFPGLINCTQIDWFHPWPRDALVSVAQRFLEQVDLGAPETRENVAHHIAEVHLSVTSASQKYLAVERRYNYVTPKSFLELINFYKKLLGDKRRINGELVERLDVGLSTLRKTAKDVADLQEDLKITLVKVDEKKLATEKLLEEMGEQRGAAEQQQEIASKEAEKANAAAAAAAKIESEAEAELAEAKPALDRAAAAVGGLSKNSLTELKAFPKPPQGVDLVTSACLIMLEGEFKNHSWDRAKKMMAKVDAFLVKLQSYRGEDMSEEVVERLTPFIQNPIFNGTEMSSKSAAAANLCEFVVNIYTYNRIYVKVRPLMDALEQARGDKESAEMQLAKVQAQVAEVEERLHNLQTSFQEATQEKAKVEAQAEACKERLGLANRLVNGLSSENERWGREIEKLRENEVSLIGNVLLASAFVSYIGAFNSAFRNELWQGVWIPDILSREIPISQGVDPLSVLTNDGNIAKMMSQGLPADRLSIENGAIINNCERWPLIVDPQLQGIKWLRNMAASATLKVIQLSQSTWVKILETSIVNGCTVIIENVQENIDATLDPVLSRAVVRRGRNKVIRFGGEEIDYDGNFKLYLLTKLANPHYKPEIAAQCTLVNFIVTESGLEDQLLARVVNTEKPELEAEKTKLQEDFNQYKIQLVELEDQLLEKLANAPPDILSDVPLIEGLEATKKTATEINAAVEKGKETEKNINQLREVYRPVASEGSMLYFLLIQLNAIDHMYQYSLDSFIVFFYKALEKATPASDDLQRVANLRESLRYTIYQWVSRGLFEKHKLIFLSQMTFNLMRRGILTEEFRPEYFNFLLRGPRKVIDENPLKEWLTDAAWASVQALGDLDEFQKMPSDLIEASQRFREWYTHVTPETEKLPLDWAGLEKQPFLKLLVLRSMRPDRMMSSISNFVRAALPNGSKYVDSDSTLSSWQVLDQALVDSSTITPVLFILSPGVDVVADVDRLSTKYGMERGVTYHNVSMGQGQDKVAMERLHMAHKQGHWVVLNNIHLMPRWLKELEKKLDEFAMEGSHEKFRLFLTSEPSNGIPIGILDRSIKLTNEPPTGLKANLKRAFCSFSSDYIDEADPKTRSILFSLCMFHAVMMERKKFGPKGFNMMYPFSLGDLRDSSVCLANYMENAGSKIPWEDLRYIFGEIIYGGHIVNDFDRLLCNKYLEFYMKDDILDEMEMFPFVEDESVSFRSPSATAYAAYLEHIEEFLNTDTPLAFGLHPNAEIGFRTEQSETMFKTLMELQPRESGGGDGGQSPHRVAESAVQDILERFGDVRFDLEELDRAIEDKGPFQNVFIQECEAVDKLLGEMSRSLLELELGFKGELTMTDAMETLMESLFLDRVPSTWAKNAWPSMRSLAAWLINLTQRIAQLQEWVANPLDVPKVTWISGLVNPQSFLTAIMQTTAQKGGLELDKLVVNTEITKRNVEDCDAPYRDGAYIHGLFLQGARWNIQSSTLEKSRPREMYTIMPVIVCKAVLADNSDNSGVFQCPVYKTEQRGPTYVFSAQLRTKSPPARWILAGVALLMDVAA